jgi:hypothetical protein
VESRTAMESLFTGVRGIGILRTSPFGDFRKFAQPRSKTYKRLRLAFLPWGIILTYLV